MLSEYCDIFSISKNQAGIQKVHATKNKIKLLTSKILRKPKTFTINQGTTSLYFDVKGRSSLVRPGFEPRSPKPMIIKSVAQLVEGTS